jgi:hypothetical protein
VVEIAADLDLEVPDPVVLAVAGLGEVADPVEV